MIRLNRLPVIFLGLTIVLVAGPDEQGRAIDPHRSSLTIHVGKAGLLSATGHEHWVNARSQAESWTTVARRPASGLLSTLECSRSRPTMGLITKTRPKCNPTCRARFWNHPPIPKSFSNRPRQVEWCPRLESIWRFCLHGTTRPVILDVTRENDAYVGAVRIKQTEFGIQPIKIGGGVVKVKDELEIHFKVFTVSR